LGEKRYQDLIAMAERLRWRGVAFKKRDKKSSKANAAKTNSVVGRVPVEKRAELAELAVVRYVTPQR
jgi:hypothetical protein